MAGQLDWPASDVIALEDAAGRFPVTRMMARRLAPDQVQASPCLTQHAANVAREAGEAVAAILAAQQSAACGEAADAITEIDEALAALRQARKKLEAL
jgi:hypothetical protein